MASESVTNQSNVTVVKGIAGSAGLICRNDGELGDAITVANCQVASARECLHRVVETVQTEQDSTTVFAAIYLLDNVEAILNAAEHRVMAMDRRLKELEA